VTIAVHCYADHLPKLIPYTDGTKWGYADTTGKIIIPLTWDRTQFFQGYKAVVSFTTSNRAKPIHCIVNMKGDYIIPPSRKWTGEYSGWNGPLNAIDSMGRWGMIDTFNNVIIPFEWEEYSSKFYSPADSFYRIVSKNGHVGVLDTNNRLIVPAIYESITTSTSLMSIGAFAVTDTNDQKSYNRSGVVDTLGKVLLPLKYNDIDYEETSLGKGFKVSVAHQEESTYSLTHRWKWVHFETGAESDYNNERDQATKFIREYGYIRFGNSRGYGLMDSNFNIIVPCCTVYRVTKDTILLRSQHKVSDSVIVTAIYLNTHTLIPYGPDKISVYYAYGKQDFTPQMSCGSYLVNLRNLQQDLASKPYVELPEWQPVTALFKDSLLLFVSGLADEGPFPTDDKTTYYNSSSVDMRNINKTEHEKYIFATSYPRGKVKRSYLTVLNKNGQLLAKPVPYMRPGGYNSFNGLLTVYPAEGFSMVLNSMGDTIVPLVSAQITNAFWCNDKLYTFVVSEIDTIKAEVGTNQHKSYYHKTVKLADSAGELIQGFLKFEVAGVCKGRSADIKAVIFRDSSGNIGLFTPESVPLFEALNFKYKKIVLTEDGLALGFSNSNKGRIVTKDNIEILPGKAIATIAKAVNIPYLTAEPVNTTDVEEIEGLYVAYFDHPDDYNIRKFYFDRYGRVYHKQEEK